MTSQVKTLYYVILTLQR